MSLRNKMAKGVLWSLLEKGGEQFLSFVIFAIVTRFIGPEAYGLVNLSSVYVAFAAIVILGMADGIVNLHLRDDQQLSTLFWAIMGTGFALCALGLVGAPAFAGLLEQPAMIPLIRLFAILPVFQAAAAVPTMIVLADMNFRVFTIRTLLATFISGILGITLAIKGYGPYALIDQQILLYFITNLVIWPSCGWRPKLTFDPTCLRRILAPGLKMTGTTFVTFFEQQAPRLLVGRFLGPIAVGFFAFTTRILQALRDTLVHPLAVVLYPAFSEIQEDLKQQTEILYHVIALTGLCVFPAVCGATITADLYVPLFFGQAWVPAIPVLKLLILSGLPAPFFIILRDFLRAHNKTGLYLKMQCGVVAIGLVAAAIAVPFGLIPLSWTIVILSMFSIPLHILMVRRWTGIDLTDGFLRLLPTLLASIVMMGGVFCLMRLWQTHDHGALRLALAMTLGAMLYVAASFAFQYRRMIEIITFAKRLKSKSPTESIGLSDAEL